MTERERVRQKETEIDRKRQKEIEKHIKTGDRYGDRYREVDRNRHIYTKTQKTQKETERQGSIEKQRETYIDRQIEMDIQ